MGRAVGPGGRRRVSGRLPPGCSAAGTDRRSGRRCHPASGLPRLESRCPRATRSATRDCDRTDTRWQPAPVAGRHPWRSADAPGTQGAGVARPAWLRCTTRDCPVHRWFSKMRAGDRRLLIGTSRSPSPSRSAKPMPRRPWQSPLNAGRRGGPLIARPFGIPPKSVIQLGSRAYTIQDHDVDRPASGLRPAPWVPPQSCLPGPPAGRSHLPTRTARAPARPVPESLGTQPVNAAL